MVSGEVTWPNEKLAINIQRHATIRHVAIADTITALDDVWHASTMRSAYQQAAIEELEHRARPASRPMHPIKDKRARSRVAARYIKNGTVKLPRHGCQQLLAQLFWLGAEKHGDAVGALVYLMLGVVGGWH